MPGCTTYLSLACQSHESCNLSAILPDFYKGKSRFELEIFCKLVYRKLQRTTGFWCWFFALFICVLDLR